MSLAMQGLRADELTLAAGDSRITGTVRSISRDGVVEIASDLSPEPVLVRQGMLRKIRFSGTEAPADVAGAVVELSNGDLIPATIESLDDTRLIIESPDTGRLEIPRDAVKSMQVGVRRQTVIFAGPNNIEEWSSADGGMKNWAFERKSLVSRGPSNASMVVELPDQFVLRFNLRWQARTNPNFQVFFADPMVEKGVPADRYYLQFGGAGLEIKREASSGKRYQTVGLLNRTPNQYPDNQVKIEIRVVRQTSRIQLFLNGEPEGEFVDPIGTAPRGSGINFVCNTSNGSSQEISGIEILDFDDKRGRHGAEERGDPATDSLISRDDDRWGGRLLGIARTNEGALFRFKNDHQQEPMEIPESDVSTVFFARSEATDKPAPPPAAHSYQLELRGKGSLKVSSCTFDQDGVSAVHPLLGELRIRRAGVEAMELLNHKPEEKPEP